MVRRQQPAANQDTKVQAIYKAVGGPQSPKVPVYWNRYHDNDEIESVLKQLESQFPKLVKIESVGNPRKSRDVDRNDHQS